MTEDGIQILEGPVEYAEMALMMACQQGATHWPSLVTAIEGLMDHIKVLEKRIEELESDRQRNDR